VRTFSGPHIGIFTLGGILRPDSNAITVYFQLVIEGAAVSLPHLNDLTVLGAGVKVGNAGEREDFGG